MLTGKKGLDFEIKELNSSIIIDKCNAKPCEHEVTICNMSNMIIDRFDSYFGKNYIKKTLESKGYIQTLRSKSSHYAVVTKKGSDSSLLALYLYFNCA